MEALEQLLIGLLLRVTDVQQLNALLGDPQTTALLTGALVALAAALPGTFLLLRKLSMTTDAISHTVLLGIVLAFLVLAALPGMEADLNSPWLILGAAVAGVATVVLTGAIQRSGLVKADAALGLVFPLLFAIAIILISRLTEDVHLDSDAVILGEIGVVWADARSHCLQDCEPVHITPDDPRAETGRRCTNCAELDIGPRDRARRVRGVLPQLRQLHGGRSLARAPGGAGATAGLLAARPSRPCCSPPCSTWASSRSSTRS